MRQRKILGVITHNDQGGAQEMLMRLFDGLSKKGYEVELWYLYKRRAISDTILPSRFILEKEASKTIDYIRIVSRLARLLVLTRPTTVISFLPLANILTQTLAWVCWVPVRVASQRNPVQTYSRVMQFLDWYVGTCGSYTHNIMNSSDVSLSVSRYPWPYRCRTKIIQNGLDAIGGCAEPRADVRTQLGLEAKDIALVSVGRLTKQKNLVFLVQILGRLKNFKLLLAGCGPEHARIAIEADRMGVSHRVIFLGSLSQSATRRLLYAADIFALPSLYEGHSNALLEAMSAGKAIVTSNLPSHQETLDDGGLGAGISIPLTEPNRWIDILKQLGSSAEERDELGRRAKRRSKYFTLDKMCSSFEELINFQNSEGSSSSNEEGEHRRLQA